MEKIGRALHSLQVSSTRSRTRRRFHTVTSAIRSSCRPAFTLGGTGGGIAYDEEELREIAASRHRNCVRPSRRFW
ncbi:MAG: hypothetical protein ACLR4Z_11955 [Butyricicoccaceae bacterium]